jgi:hypothetical protein
VANEAILDVQSIEGNSLGSGNIDREEAYAIALGNCEVGRINERVKRTWK